jgi:hypothetical protein
MAVAKKEKPGEWHLALGFVGLVLGAFFAFSTLFEFMPRYAKLRDHGMVAQGVVREHLTKTSTSRKGRVRKSYYAVIGYSQTAALPYNKAQLASSDTAAEQLPTKAPTGDEVLARVAAITAQAIALPAFPYQYEMGVSEDELATNPIGKKISVTFLPENPSESQLTEDVRSYSPILPLLFGFGFLFAGIYAVGAGWKLRSAYNRALKQAQS